MTLDLAALRPAPDKVVANLPYGVAATVLLRTVEELADVTLWVAMVQREVAERLAAEPGSKTYGATSVLAQLACEVKVLRRVPRTVFHPTPNVESALLRMRRTGPAAPAPVAALVHAAFAHRRKALAGSLALAPGGARGHPRPRPRGARRARAPRRRARRAPGAAGLHRAGVATRASVAGPRQRCLSVMSVVERAPAKVNLVLHVGGPRARTACTRCARCSPRSTWPTT